ncbi:putative Ig domain-containing protein [Marinobacter xestospongiae]|uniref:Ig domain-containing protein n=1 Tax=Marinobacter xestospongiae TaxID=994319 RepID=A0ABU3VW56_9GAMM|nr:putative Ig domain-containing protein [Marinobacter xestospongiae]MDV2078509.1 putative Ig domain-containing protein [Marinobacter xestospongiae]
MKWMRIIGWWWLTGMALFAAQVHAQESLCAVVKIEIAQELTLERQAFEASMRITNSLDTMALENLTVAIEFEDSDGEPVLASSDPNHGGARFFIDLDAHNDISSLEEGSDGAVTDGVIDPAEVGELRWLIVPTAGAGGDDGAGRLYYVGAELSFTYGGKSQIIEVAPDSIIVKPQPNLVLDYFLPTEVNGDNPFTPEIEPIEPYHLGVRVGNTGSGPAHAVKIQSAQPRIVENERGLLVDFTITGSFVDDQPAAKTLLTDFGSVPARSNTTARWIMETSLTGSFTEFDASFSHADEYGGELTSLIDNVSTHFLVHDVLVDLPGRDPVRDFLSRDGDSLRVFESERTGQDLPMCRDCFAVTAPSAQLGSARSTGLGASHTLAVAPQAEPAHLKVADPYQGAQPVSAAIRADGSALPGANVWLSKTLRDDNVTYDHYLNLFDTSVAGNYTVTFGGSPAGNRAPVMRVIPQQSTYETGQVGFLVTASDPDQSMPELSATGLPSGATFVDQGDGSGVFSWFPQIGQAGQYPLLFVASDGELTAQQETAIRVYPNDDRDGDGLSDAWEMEHFGDLSRDGTGDFDGDGVSDLDEFKRGSDPTVLEQAPAAPQLDAPADNAEVTTLEPTLRVTNGDHQGVANVTYTFELYGTESMSHRLALLEGITEGVDTTEVVLDASALGGEPLADNHRYYWRVNARSGSGASEWVNGRFFTNTANDAPAAFTLSRPVDQVLVDTETPVLEVNNSADLDEDTITYSFEVYHESDAGFTNPVASVSGLAQGPQGQTRWTVSTPLLNGQLYYWIAIATDEHGEATVGQPASFIVSTSNLAPAVPQLASPVEDEVVSGPDVELRVHNALDPERRAVSYYFELDTVNTFDSAALQQSPEIQETLATTAWSVTGLVPGQRYFWRAKASDGEAESDWQQGQFRMYTPNEAPGAPTLANPADQAWVEVLTPGLSVHPVEDPDGDEVRYQFELYRDDGLIDLVAKTTTLDTMWSLQSALQNHHTYFWRARAVDRYDAQSPWSPVQRFFTNQDGVDDPPSLEFVLPDQAMSVYGGEITVQWVDQDPDSNATISFFANGDIPIISGLEEDADGDSDRFQWNLSSLPVGDYTLSAVIEDQTSRVTVESCCVIRKLASDAVLNVSEVTEPVTDETGSRIAEFDISLDQAPQSGSSVLINLAVSGAGEGRLLDDLRYLEFTADSWSTLQRVRLAGVDDCEVDGSQTFHLSFAPATSTDPRFDGMVAPDVALTNQDNEQPGQALILCDFQALGASDQGNGDSHYEFQARLVNNGLGIAGAEASADQTGNATPMSGYPLVFPAIAEGGSAASGRLVLAAPSSSAPNPLAFGWQIDADVPEIISVPPTDAVVGEEYRYQVEVRDSAASFSLVDAPDGAMIDPVSGLVTWTPATAQQGAQRVVIEVRDGRGGVSRQEIWLDVSPEGQGNARVIIVDTNPAASTPHHSLNAAVQALRNDIDGAFTQPIVLRARATSGIADTTPMHLLGLQPTAENPLTLVLENGYTLSLSATGNKQYAMHIKSPHVHLKGEGGRIVVENNGYDAVAGVRYELTDTASVAFLDRLRIEGHTTGEPTLGAGLYLGRTEGTFVVRNSVVTGFTGVETNTGIYVESDVYLYNNTVAYNRFGIYFSRFDKPAYNNLAVANEAMGFTRYLTLWGPSANNVSDGFSPDEGFGDRDVTFVDAAAGDFRLVPWDTGAREQGVDLSQAEFYPFAEDAEGKPRAAPWHVGALGVGDVDNWPPVFESEPVVQVDEGESYRYNAEALDQNGDAVRYQLVDGPTGMAVSESSGTVTWAPTNEQVGEFAVTLRASDSLGAFTEQSFRVLVSPAGSGGARLVVMDTDPSADTPYHSLAEVLAAHKGELEEPLLIRARASSGVVDTVPAQVWKIGSGPDRLLTIVLEAGYRLEVQSTRSYSGALDVRQGYVRIKGEGGEVVVHNNGYANSFGILVNPDINHPVWVDNLRVRGVNSGAPMRFVGLACYESHTVCVFRNNVITGFDGDITSMGLYANGTVHAYNNTLVGNGSGLHSSNTDNYLINNLSVGNTYKDYRRVGSDLRHKNTRNNLSSDDTALEESLRHQAVVFVDAAAGDYRLLPSDSIANDGGVDLSSGVEHAFNFDALGQPRNVPWSIGALPVRP